MSRAGEHLAEIDARVALFQGIGENLPFRSCLFDKVMCKGALDHFLSLDKTMEEISRVLKPDGEVIISIANFESLGFRIGKKVIKLKTILSRKIGKQRRPWELPPDHNYKFDYPFLTSLLRTIFR